MGEDHKLPRGSALRCNLEPFETQFWDNVTVGEPAVRPAVCNTPSSLTHSVLRQDILTSCAMTSSSEKSSIEDS